MAVCIQICENICHPFHDDSIYGFQLISPEPDLGDWRSELVLDIDHIEEWLQDEAGHIRFRLLQAQLTFVDVTDLMVSFGFPGTSLVPLPIDRISRSDKPTKIRGDDGTEYLWAIELNDQLKGAFAFCASGYRLTPLGDPIECDQQQIPPHLRHPN